jgi:hypothetical protein
MPRTTKKGVIPEKHFHPSMNHYSSRFELEPTCPFGHGSSKDFNISNNTKEELRGSPSLVGRYLGKVEVAGSNPAQGFLFFIALIKQ